MARLRAAQEKVLDRRSEMDELRARRSVQNLAEHCLSLCMICTCCTCCKCTSSVHLVMPSGCSVPSSVKPLGAQAEETFWADLTLSAWVSNFQGWWMCMVPLLRYLVKICCCRLQAVADMEWQAKERWQPSARQLFLQTSI